MDDFLEMNAAFDQMSGLVGALRAPHENHTGMPCHGGRPDCCWRCATLEGLLPGVREMNDLMQDSDRHIALPEWCESVKWIQASPLPLEQFQHEHCLTCGHRDTRMPPLSLDETLRRHYPEAGIASIIKETP